MHLKDNEMIADICIMWMNREHSYAIARKLNLTHETVRDILRHKKLIPQISRKYDPVPQKVSQRPKHMELEQT